MLYIYLGTTTILTTFEGDSIAHKWKNPCAGSLYIKNAYLAFFGNASRSLVVSVREIFVCVCGWGFHCRQDNALVDRRHDPLGHVVGGALIRHKNVPFFTAEKKRGLAMRGNFLTFGSRAFWLLDYYKSTWMFFWKIPPIFRIKRVGIN